MQVKYVMSKKDLKQLMEKKQKQGGYYLLIIASTYYIILNICLSIMTFWLFYLSYAVFIALVWLLLDTINKYYIKYAMKLNDKVFNYFYGESLITINDNVLVQKDDHKEVKINLEDIKKIVIRANTVIIIPSRDKQNNTNKALIFYQSFFKDKSDFYKIKEYFKKIVNSKK